MNGFKSKEYLGGLDEEHSMPKRQKLGDHGREAVERMDSKGQPALNLQGSSVMPNATRMDGTLSKRSLWWWCSHIGKLTHGGCLVFEKRQGKARQGQEIFVGLKS
jgi:hypothetical protein